MENNSSVKHETYDDLRVDGHYTAARCSEIKEEPTASDCEDEPFVDMGGFLELETVVKNESTLEDKIIEAPEPSRLRRADEIEAERTSLAERRVRPKDPAACTEVPTFPSRVGRTASPSKKAPGPRPRAKNHVREAIQCPTCGKTFSERHTLSQHAKLHDGTRPYACETCALTFSRASHLRQHANTHVGARAYGCATCSKRFTLKSSLVRHMTTHRLPTDDRRFMCEVCGKAFKQSATLKSHTYVHSDGAKPFVCEACGKSFARKGSLRVHARAHSGARVFACALCNKTFTTNGKLTIHTRNHTGSRPYGCEKCDRSFNQSSALKQHAWTHTGFRPLQCPLCCKGFIRKIRLTDHLKQCGK